MADPTDPPEPKTDPTDPPEPTDPPDLGDAGKRALEAERSARKAAEKEAKRAKDLEAELETLRTKHQSESERAIAAAKAEGITEERTRSNERIVRAEVKVAATGKLHHPADALLHIDLADFAVDDSGNVDTKSIAKAIDDLVKERPDLAAGDNGRPAPGAANGGPRGAAVDTADMNAIIRERMRR